METTEDLRWFFIAIIMRVKQHESASDCRNDVMLRDSLLRIKAAETDGLFFILEDYVEQTLREADTYRDSHLELARVLEVYVQFEYCLQIFGQLPHLRQLFKKARLNRWLEMRSYGERFRPHVSRYFELLDRATLKGDELSEDDIDRCEYLSFVFGVPLTIKLQMYKTFFEDTEPKHAVSEYEK